MDKLDYWRLCTDFTVVQAALIICGVSPEEMQWDVERKAEGLCPPGYVAIRTAMNNALQSGRLKPSNAKYVLDDEGFSSDHYDVQTTTISTDEIDRFLKSAGVVCDFFDRPGRNGATPPTAQRLMPIKLNAALKAWAAVSEDPARLRGKSPKQALDQWLTEHAAELGLLNRDGLPNRTGIEEICKVANWKPEGGATPTTISAATIARPLIRLPSPAPDFTVDLDDEIPF